MTATLPKTCTRPNCAERHEARGFCKHHYGKLIRTGRLPIIAALVDPAPIRARIELQLAHGRSLHNLSEAASVDFTWIKRIHSGESSCRKTTAARIMAVPLPPTFVGICRRLSALERIGYSRAGFCRASGVASATLSRALRTGVMSAPLRFAVATAYETLSVKPIDAPRAVLLATRAGHFPPADWEYVDIDDPAAHPEDLTSPERSWGYTTLPEGECAELLVAGEFYGNVTGEPHRGSRLQAVVMLTKRGWDAHRIGRWLRMTPRTVARMRTEASGQRCAPRPQHCETHCRGAEKHELTPENTRVDGRGARHCRICERIGRQARRARAA